MFGVFNKVQDSWVEPRRILVKSWWSQTKKGYFRMKIAF